MKLCKCKKREAEPGYARCAECREQQRARHKERWATEPEYREERRRLRNNNQTLRRKDPVKHAADLKQRRIRAKERLATDPEYRRKLNRKYNHSAGAQERRNRWQAKNVDKMQRYHRDYYAAWNKANAQQVILGRELRKALAAGTVQRPTACSTCGKECQPRAFLGALDLAVITWHCPKCLYQVNQQYKGK